MLYTQEGYRTAISRPVSVSAYVPTDGNENVKNIMNRYRRRITLRASGDSHGYGGLGEGDHGISCG